MNRPLLTLLIMIARQIPKVQTQHSKRNRNVALGGALALHGLLMALPSMENINYQLEPSIVVRLQVDQPAEQRQSAQPRQEKKQPTPLQPLLEEEKQPAVLLQQQDDSRSSINLPTPPISLDTERFAEQETKALLDANPQALSEFEKSFAESTIESRASLSHFQNQYGEIRVITQVGNRDVCYLQNKQFVDDDFGFNMVMFYDCNKNTNYRNDIKLELP